jgi:hypothetical protein
LKKRRQIIYVQADMLDGSDAAFLRAANEDFEMGIIARVIDDFEIGIHVEQGLRQCCGERFRLQLFEP